MLCVAVAPVARAQTSSDSAAAQGLFDEAKALMAAGKAAEACPKFEESQRLDPGSGSLVNLAKCYEQTGRLASAWSKYLEAAGVAKAAGNSGRETGARELAAALAPRVSKLVLNVAEEARLPGLEITRDGSAVGSAQWGLGIPADAGQHTVVAKAPGHKEWTSVAVVEGEGTSTTVSVPKLDEGAPATTGAESERGSSGLGTQKTLALVAGGVGVVGIGIGTVFGLKTMSKQSDAEKYCNGTACRDARGVSAGNEAHAAGNIATIGVVVGAVGLAGGLTLWFTAPKSGGSTEVAVGPGIVQLRRTW